MAHKWFVSNASIIADYGGKTGRVYPATCSNPGCGASTVFPVNPFDFKGVIAPSMSPCVSWSSNGGHFQGVREVSVLMEAKKEDVMAARGGGGANAARAHYYDEHRSEILSDFKQTGKLATVRKWGIPEGTWGGLLRRWNRSRSTPSYGVRGLSEHGNIVHDNGNGNDNGNDNGHGHSADSDYGTMPILTLAASGQQGKAGAHVSRARLADLLLELAKVEESTDFSRAMRLAAKLVELSS